MLTGHKMAPYLKINNYMAFPHPLSGHTVCCSAVLNSVVIKWICRRRAVSSNKRTKLSSREDCCQRGLAKITIMLSQAESRTPSSSLSLINWDLGSTWVSLVARFKWLLVNDRATPWAVPSSRPGKMRLVWNVINRLSGVTTWHFSTYRSVYSLLFVAALTNMF